MHLRRGLQRAWTAATLLWLGFVAAVAYANRVYLYGPCPESQATRELVACDIGLAHGPLDGDMILFIGAVALGPPMALWAIGQITAWVWRGFAATR